MQEEEGVLSCGEGLIRVAAASFICVGVQQFESILERVSTTLQRACTEVANLSHAVEHKEDVFEGVAGATKVGH